MQIQTSGIVLPWEDAHLAWPVQTRTQGLWQIGLLRIAPLTVKIAPTPCAAVSQPPSASRRMPGGLLACGAVQKVSMLSTMKIPGHARDWDLAHHALGVAPRCIASRLFKFGPLNVMLLKHSSALTEGWASLLVSSLMFSVLTVESFLETDLLGR